MAVTGSKAGVGYVELTNYDRYPYGQTDETTPLQPLRVLSAAEPGAMRPFTRR